MIYCVKVVPITELLAEAIRGRIRGVSRSGLRESLNQLGVEFELLDGMNWIRLNTHRAGDSLQAFSAGMRLLGA